MRARAAPRRVGPGAPLRALRRPPPSRRAALAGRRRPARAPGAPRSSRKGRWALAAALLVLLLLWVWPAPPEPVAPPPPEPPPAPVAMARPAAVKKKPVARKPAPPPPPAPAPASQRALLRRALEARAPDLRACPLPPGVPPTLGARIRVAKGGATQAATLSSAQRLPRELSDCLRQHLMKWEFSDVGLTSDVEVFVDFALGP